MKTQIMDQYMHELRLAIARLDATNAALAQDGHTTAEWETHLYNRAAAEIRIMDYARLILKEYDRRAEAEAGKARLPGSKLSKQQRALLAQLDKIDEANLRWNADKRTLRSLESRGFVTSRYIVPPGHDYGMELHRITPAGRRALEVL